MFSNACTACGCAQWLWVLDWALSQGDDARSIVDACRECATDTEAEAATEAEADDARPAPTPM